MHGMSVGGAHILTLPSQLMLMKKLRVTRLTTSAAVRRLGRRALITSVRIQWTMFVVSLAELAEAAEMHRLPLGLLMTYRWHRGAVCCRALASLRHKGDSPDSAKALEPGRVNYEVKLRAIRCAGRPIASR